MNYKQCAKLLLTHENSLIVTHRNPDGDTVGSAADGSFSATNRQLICPYLEAVATDPAGQYQPDTLTVQTFATAQETDIVLPTISLKKK